MAFTNLATQQHVGEFQNEMYENVDSENAYENPDPLKPLNKFNQPQPPQTHSQQPGIQQLPQSRIKQSRIQQSPQIHGQFSGIRKAPQQANELSRLQKAAAFSQNQKKGIVKKKNKTGTMKMFLGLAVLAVVFLTIGFGVGFLTCYSLG